MKRSIIFTLLILAVAAGIGWRNSQRLEGVRRSHTLVTDAAAQVGVALNPGDAKRPIRVGSPNRADQAAIAKQAAAEMIPLLKKYGKMEEKDWDATSKAEILGLTERVSAFNGDQVAVYIAEIQRATGLDEEFKNDVVAGEIIMLSMRDPQSAFEIFLDHSETVQKTQYASIAANNIFYNWAKSNPAKALQWMKSNGEKFPQLVNDTNKNLVLGGMAGTDPKMAFQTLAELGLKDVNEGIENIVWGADTEEQRTQVMAALRGYLGKISDETGRKEAVDSAMRSFGSNVAKQGFEAGTRWIAAEKFSPEEICALASNLSESIKPGEQPKWIEWVGKQLPEEEVDVQVGNIVNRWTEKDYLAAGKWLSAAPAGTVKNSAIRGYAEAVSTVEPETAAQWAMTLPPGKEREETIRRIHNNWPKETPEGKAAAAAFAQQHGIGK